MSPYQQYRRAMNNHLAKRLERKLSVAEEVEWAVQMDELWKQLTDDEQDAVEREYGQVVNLRMMAGRKPRKDDESE